MTPDQSREAHHAYLQAKAADPVEARFWRDAPPFPALSSPAAPQAADPTKDATAVIAQAARAQPGLTMVCLGSMTNLALALRQDPNLAGRLGRVVHMGGMLRPEQGSAAWQGMPDIPDDVWRETLRFNTLYDPAASLEAMVACRVRMVPADVTVRAVLDDAVLEAWTRGGPLGRFLAPRVRPWQGFSQTLRGLGGMHLHDPLALLLALEPELALWEKRRVNAAALLAGDNALLAREADGPMVEAAVDLRPGALKALREGLLGL